MTGLLPVVIIPPSPAKPDLGSREERASEDRRHRIHSVTPTGACGEVTGTQMRGSGRERDLSPTFKMEWLGPPPQFWHGF